MDDEEVFKRVAKRIERFSNSDKLPKELGRNLQSIAHCGCLVLNVSDNGGPDKLFDSKRDALRGRCTTSINNGKHFDVLISDGIPWVTPGRFET